MNNLEERIIKIFRKAVNISEDVVLTSDTMINTLEVNSLNFLKIIVEIEEEFAIEFEDEELNFYTFNSIKDIVELVKNKQNNWWVLLFV